MYIDGFVSAQRRVFDLGDRCLFGGEVFEDADVVFEDDCTTCICLVSITSHHNLVM